MMSRGPCPTFVISQVQNEAGRKQGRLDSEAKKKLQIAPHPWTDVTQRRRHPLGAGIKGGREHAGRGQQLVGGQKSEEAVAVGSMCCCRLLNHLQQRQHILRMPAS